MRRSLLVNMRTSRGRKSDAFLEPLNNYGTVFFVSIGFNWMSLLPWALLSVSPLVGSPLLSVERPPSFISFSLVQLLFPSFAFSLADSTCRSNAIFIVSRRPEPPHSKRMRRRNERSPVLSVLPSACPPGQSLQFPFLPLPLSASLIQKQEASSDVILQILQIL